MADFHALSAACMSIERLLNRCLQLDDPLGGGSSAVLIRTEDLLREPGSLIDPPCITIYPYRVALNAVTRPGWSAAAYRDGVSHLPLDIHFLLTAWASDASRELTLLGRAMQCLEEKAVLSGPLLDPGASWAPQEAVQVCIGEITTEDVMRTFDSLPADFKVSVPYVARVVRLSGRVAEPAPDVATVTTGLTASALP